MTIETDVGKEKPTASTPFYIRISRFLKSLAAILLGILIIGSLILLVLATWPQTSTTSPSFTSSSTTVDKEAVLKEKLEGYSKRTDDLQKITSLLLGLSTIYAIALGLGAYASVQGNVQQAKDLIANAKEEVRTLKGEVIDFQRIKNTEMTDLRSGVQKALAKADHATRIAIAYMVADFPEVTGLQQQSIQRLVAMRDGDYAEDRAVNLCLAKLYRLLGEYQSSEETLTRFLTYAERSKERDDVAISAAYYDRACSRSLRLTSAKSEERELLMGGIKRDLKRAFDLDESCRLQAAETEPSKKDEELDGVRNEEWFKSLIRD